jgi:hypothetical protein
MNYKTKSGPFPNQEWAVFCGNAILLRRRTQNAPLNYATQFSLIYIVHAYTSKSTVRGDFVLDRCELTSRQCKHELT